MRSDWVAERYSAVTETRSLAASSFRSALMRSFCARRQTTSARPCFARRATQAPPWLTGVTPPSSTSSASTVPLILEPEPKGPYLAISFHRTGQFAVSTERRMPDTVGAVGRDGTGLEAVRPISRHDRVARP